MDIETIEQPESLQNLHKVKMEKYTHYIQTFFFLRLWEANKYKKNLSSIGENNRPKLVRHNNYDLNFSDI